MAKILNAKHMWSQWPTDEKNWLSHAHVFPHLVGITASFESFEIRNFVRAPRLKLLEFCSKTKLHKIVGVQDPRSHYTSQRPRSSHLDQILNQQEHCLQSRGLELTLTGATQAAFILAGSVSSWALMSEDALCPCTRVLSAEDNVDKSTEI